MDTFLVVGRVVGVEESQELPKKITIIPLTEVRVLDPCGRIEQKRL